MHWQSDQQVQIQNRKKKDTSYAQWAKSTVDEPMTVHTLNDATGVGEATKLTANCLTSHSVSHMKRV